MGSDIRAAQMGGDAAILGKTPSDEVIEVSLLLTASRMEALVALSRQRQQSVGQILRGLIDRALAGEC